MGCDPLGLTRSGAMLFCYEKNPRWSHGNQSKHSKILHLVWNIVNFVSCLSLSQGFWCCKRKMRRIAWVLEGCSQAVWGLVFAPTWFAAELIIRKFLLIKRQPLDERLLSRLTRHVHDWWLCLCVLQSQRATDGMTMCHAAMNFPILFENGEPTTLQAQHAVEGRNHHPQTAPRYWEIHRSFRSAGSVFEPVRVYYGILGHGAIYT